MVFYNKISANDSNEVIYCIENINEDKSYAVITKYLTEHLGCVVTLSLYGRSLDFSRNGITFRYISLDSIMGSYFCSPNHKMESPEYYEKLERIVQELVDALNRDDHMLHLSK